MARQIPDIMLLTFRKARIMNRRATLAKSLATLTTVKTLMRLNHLEDSSTILWHNIKTVGSATNHLHLSTYTNTVKPHPSSITLTTTLEYMYNPTNHLTPSKTFLTNTNTSSAATRPASLLMETSRTLNSRWRTLNSFRSSQLLSLQTQPYRTLPLSTPHIRKTRH